MAISLRQTPFPMAHPGQLRAARHLTPAELQSGICGLPRTDLAAFVRAHIQERTPAAFSDRPLLWESVRNWLSSRFDVHPREIGLSGSSQLGFSIVPKKNWAPFNSGASDLDLFVVNAALHSSVEAEARRFVATNAVSGKYDDQVRTIENLLRRGWIDVKHIPADHDRYPSIANLLNDASIVIDRLKRHDFQLKPSSIRIYSTWAALGDWTKLTYGRFCKV